MKNTVNTKFYTFSQNNSGGLFIKSEKEGISECVIIEALEPNHANTRAEEIGLYFDGCDKGEDCSCCGDRWYRTSERDGYEVPSVYGKLLSDMEKSSHIESCFVHYLDGKFEKIEFKQNADDVGV